MIEDVFVTEDVYCVEDDFSCSECFVTEDAYCVEDDFYDS